MRSLSFAFQFGHLENMAMLVKLAAETEEIYTGKSHTRLFVVFFQSQAQFDEMEGMLFDTLIEPLNDVLERRGLDEIVDDAIEVESLDVPAGTPVDLVL